MPDDLTNTDKKIIYSDHDLLVRLNTLVETSLRQQEEFRDSYQDNMKELVQRVTSLEVKQASNIVQIDSNKSDIADLQKKSDRYDIINAAFTALAGALAAWWGGSR